MMAQPESDEALVLRMLPSVNPNREDRARAWAEWHARIGGQAVLKFIRVKNNTAELDEDILQDAMLTAYLEVERGRYEQRAGIPFTAYVKGIAHNKIREARRRQGRWEALDEIDDVPSDGVLRQIEHALESRERHQALRQGLLQLSIQRRQVLERYLGGESLSEIAARLDMTADVVRQHKHRGLRRLQQMSFFQ
ncbi:MAG TPA: sigma-70 family RNA polymerase sigma factor [Anaerolineae bacterium]